MNLPPEQQSPSARFGRLAGTVLRDVQFWVPVVVLIGGLLVLRWIH
jgi:hypothetical protein